MSIYDYTIIAALFLLLLGTLGCALLIFFGAAFTSRPHPIESNARTDF